MSNPSESLALVLPFCYWLGTRLRKGGQRVQYVFAVLGLQVLWIVNLSAGWDLLVAFAVSFAAMICVYELGYIANDHWAQNRERAAGLEVRKEDPAKVPLSIFTVGIVLRLLAVALLLGVIESIWSGAGHLLGYLTAVLGVFMLHNVVLGRVRVGTFFMLYVLRLALPLVVVLIAPTEPDLVAVWSWTIYGTVFSAAFALTYGLKKGYLKSPVFLSMMGGIELPLIITSSTALGISLCAWLAGETDLAGWLAAMAAWHLGYWVVWASLRFGVELRNGVRRARSILSHCHTNYSHDGSITVSDYRAWLEEDPERHVFLTDHAEDFDAETFSRLKRDFDDLAHRVTVGLEFPIARQHILAHGLEVFPKIDGLSTADAMSTLRDEASPIIWAHPRFAFRGLLRPTYLGDLLTLLALSDGIEFFNPKNVRRARYRVMMLFMSWLGGALYGRKLLYIGVDAHIPIDLPALRTWRSEPRSVSKSRHDR